MLTLVNVALDTYLTPTLRTVVGKIAMDIAQPEPVLRLIAILIEPHAVVFHIHKLSELAKVFVLTTVQLGMMTHQPSQAVCRQYGQIWNLMLLMFPDLGQVFTQI